ncbi:hypothetical protein J8I87_09645, partial [Paraburkholderia sp. LEh10]|uniref:hypothetical protein n=1 Tax=Paraburkholderia sp. LEh10 TaxID=2821353 RepID=UPI001AE8A999
DHLPYGTEVSAKSRALATTGILGRILFNESILSSHDSINTGSDTRVCAQFHNVATSSPDDRREKPFEWAGTSRRRSLFHQGNRVVMVGLLEETSGRTSRTEKSLPSCWGMVHAIFRMRIIILLPFR